jgi:hypothetical protein
MADKSNKSLESILPYEIESTEDKVQIDNRGKPQTVKVVRYRTFLGDTGEVTVQKRDYSASLVQQLIYAELEETAKLRGLMP